MRKDARPVLMPIDTVFGHLKPENTHGTQESHVISHTTYRAATSKSSLSGP
jgi:hypothetical protein